MPTAYQADVRPITATIDGKGPHIVTTLSMRAEISNHCTLSASLVCEDLIADKSLGKVLKFDITSPQESTTLLGLITTISLQGFSEEKALYYYTLEAKDPLSLLTFRRNRKIFQNMTSKQIIEDVLNEAGIKSNAKLSVSGSGTTHEYCTQADETDLAFVQRLMSFGGWHYHFDHSSSKPMITVGDSNQTFKAITDNTFTYQTPNPEPSREVSSS